MRAAWERKGSGGRGKVEEEEEEGGEEKSSCG
jgi:hypothetical protein